ncbi:MAG: hypothetical protein EB830_00900 [Nitrosopumilus sp. H13]|nr:MAG: hypothetical protein EB830_00900 [Nitrosopumilus sp. H13]
MLEEIAKNLSGLKAAFAKEYAGSAHIQEIIPASPVHGFPDPAHLGMLHEFAEKNPLYSGSFEQDVAGVCCVVYEGDIGQYWLDSTKHGSSCQPFYPTWITSAYALACMAKRLGYCELVDVGSGDGRIAYCGAVAGLVPYSIEIDGALAGLQKEISESTGIRINPRCCDALEADYLQMNLERPVFVIGGLAQMGGDILASGIIEKTQKMSGAGVVLAGTYSKRSLSGSTEYGGWGEIIKRYGLEVTNTVTLPTVWTFDQETDTPYIHARLAHGAYCTSKK